MKDLGICKFLWSKQFYKSRVTYLANTNRQRFTEPNVTKAGDVVRATLVYATWSFDPAQNGWIKKALYLLVPQVPFVCWLCRMHHRGTKGIHSILPKSSTLCPFFWMSGTIWRPGLVKRYSPKVFGERYQNLRTTTNFKTSSYGN